jgi:hypothetical protein
VPAAQLLSPLGLLASDPLRPNGRGGGPDALLGTSSIGWLGAVAADLALDLTAVTSDDVQVVRGAYIAMQAVVSAVIVPLALVAVVIGVVNALGTPWGLVRHYWVLASCC